MKKQFDVTVCYATKPVNDQRLPHGFKMNMTLFASFLLALSILLFTACKKQSTDSAPAAGIVSNNLLRTEQEFRTIYQGLEDQTFWELQQARAATARYRDIKNAFKDGYKDISVVVENMGSHYMKAELANGTFDFRKPAILVYHEKEDGSLELGAAEYAVPLGPDPSTDKAPEGFTGTADEWERNEDFDLWLLHAWVWTFNPEGVFNPTNPLVHHH